LVRLIKALGFLAWGSLCSAVCALSWLTLRWTAPPRHVHVLTTAS
jgi:hypothetical protein